MSIALHYSFRQIDHRSLCDDKKIPEDLVEQVYLKFCDLIKFPEWLTRLQNLTHINISCNAIEHVPSTLNLLTNLNYLDMSDNRLTSLAPTLFELTRLRYLDVATNFIEVIPPAIKNLTNLEYLSFDRNFIMEIPAELSECVSIIQMSFDECSRLFSIPSNLLMMPNLVNVSLRSCNFIVLPSMISSKIENFLFNGNQLLNCLPHEALKFLPINASTSDFYLIEEGDLMQLTMAQTSFINNSPEIKHIVLANGVIANIPQNINRVFTLSSPEIASLKELCLRSVGLHERFALPRELETDLGHPIAICSCGAKMFNEVFATFFYEKSRSNLQLIITKMFCTKKCLKLFYVDNKAELLFVT